MAATALEIPYIQVVGRLPLLLEGTHNNIPPPPYELLFLDAPFSVLFALVRLSFFTPSKLFFSFRANWYTFEKWNIFARPQLSAVHHMQSSFEEASAFSRYHPSKGYYWDFKSQKGPEKVKIPEKEKPKEESSSLFQRQRVDMLLGELIMKFPLPTPPQPKPAATARVKTESENGALDVKDKADVKQENKAVKPPVDKKPRLN